MRIRGAMTGKGRKRTVVRATLAGAVIGGAVGWFLGSSAGLAGYGTAMNAGMPGAAVGALVLGLAALALSLWLTEPGNGDRG